MTASKRKKSLRRLESLPERLNDYRHPDEKPGRAGSARREAERQSLVEQRIQEAMAEGAFDNLPGAGKPQPLNENPFVEPGQAWAFGLLKRNGFAPRWIELGKQIRQETAAARDQLRRAWQFHQQNPDESAAGWARAVARFEEAAGQINRKIDDYNLLVPLLSSQQPRLSTPAELRRAQSESDEK